MTNDEMRALYDRHVAAENAEDIDAVMETWHDDCYQKNATMGAVVSGKDGVRRYYEGVFANFPGNVVDIEGYAYGDDLLVAWGSGTATFGDSFFGLPSKPGTHTMRSLTVVTFKEGLMESETTYPEMVALLDAIDISFDDLRDAMKGARR
jgi:steroid delta-isomerase-like uncharacterized protein